MFGNILSCTTVVITVVYNSAVLYHIKQAMTCVSSEAEAKQGFTQQTNTLQLWKTLIYQIQSSVHHLVTVHITPMSNHLVEDFFLHMSKISLQNYPSCL